VPRLRTPITIAGAKSYGRDQNLTDTYESDPTRTSQKRRRPGRRT
jgi:hypothetical protein